MQWPPWSTPSSSSSSSSSTTAPPPPSPPPPKPPPPSHPPPISWPDILSSPDASHYTDPRNLLPTLLLTTSILACIRIHRLYLRRIPGATHIRPSFFRKRSLFGEVTRVGDADNFHLFHTPGGRAAGWGWMVGRKVPAGKGARGKTIHIRIAGIDAPEGAHFGHPAQPYSAEALAWLKAYILHRRVRAYIYKRDQYERVVATVYVRRFLVRRDVGREMLRAGWATVYEAKAGAEFGGKEMEAGYRADEELARRKGRGIWGGTGVFESPREFKTRMGEKEGKGEAVKEEKEGGGLGSWIWRLFK